MDALKRVLFIAIFSIVMNLHFSQSAFSYDGNDSGGGTDNNAETLKVKDFVKYDGRMEVAPIDPKIFDGVYTKLLPRYQDIENKIPGLGEALLDTFDHVIWKVTKEEFPNPETGFIRSIDQNYRGIFISIPSYKKMKEVAGEEEAQKAFFHESVRKLVMTNRHYYWTYTKNLEDEQKINGELVRTQKVEGYYYEIPTRLVDDKVHRVTTLLWNSKDRDSKKLLEELQEIIPSDVFVMSMQDLKELNERFLLSERLKVCSLNRSEIKRSIQIKSKMDPWFKRADEIFMRDIHLIYPGFTPLQDAHAYQPYFQPQRTADRIAQFLTITGNAAQLDGSRLYKDAIRDYWESPGCSDRRSCPMRADVIIPLIVNPSLDQRVERYLEGCSVLTDADKQLLKQSAKEPPLTERIRSVEDAMDLLGLVSSAPANEQAASRQSDALKKKAIFAQTNAPIAQTNAQDPLSQAAR